MQKPVSATPLRDAAKLALDAPRKIRSTAEILAEFEREQTELARVERERKEREHRELVKRQQAEVTAQAAKGDLAVQRLVGAIAAAAMGANVDAEDFPPAACELNQGDARRPVPFWMLGSVLDWLDRNPHLRVLPVIRFQLDAKNFTEILRR